MKTRLLRVAMWLIRLRAEWAGFGFGSLRSTAQPAAVVLAAIAGCLGPFGPVPLHAQTAVRITVDATSPGTPWHPIWNWFGADEPNYLTTAGGRALLAQLAHLDPGVPVYFRPHNLLTSGNGTPALKWGSTGVYSEDNRGVPHYDWRITDQLFDALVHSGITPFVEVGFTPEELSPHPRPYQHSFPHGSVFTGWSYPPDNDAKWSALITAWARHLRARYGPQVEHWRWEVWNEPDIDYFHGTEEQYFHLYDITAAALERAIPHALVGGPAVTGPYKNGGYLRAFLEHCAHGVNAATGARGAPLTFISFHPKGAPKVVSGTAQMGIWQQLHAMDLGFRTVASVPEFAHLPIILSESDPEGCAACLNPANTYRNDEAYGTAVLEATARSLELAQGTGVHLEGAVNWSFLFPGQPLFAGFRSLAVSLPDPAHPILDKPVLETFRLLGKLGGEQLPVMLCPAAPSASGVSTLSCSGPSGTFGTTPIPALLAPGPHSDLSALATRRSHELDLLVWSYSDMLQHAVPTSVLVNLQSLPAQSLHLQRFLIDTTHGNTYTAWKQMGSPQRPTPAQVRTLLAAEQLTPVEERELAPNHAATLQFPLARNAATLLQITWH